MQTGGRFNRFRDELTLRYQMGSTRPLIIKCITNAMLLILSFSISLVVAESAARTFFPQDDPSGQVRFIRSPDGTKIGPPGAVLRQFKNIGDYDVEVRF